MPDHKPEDMASSAIPFLWAWGLPLIVLVMMNFASGILPLHVIVLIMSGVFVWMGTACLFNAKRCRRRHCFYSGPIFLLGALAVLLVGFEIVSMGSDGLIITVWATLGLALLTYVTEIFQGKYIS